MNYRWDKKYLHWGVTAFLVLSAAILFFAFIYFFSEVQKTVGTLFETLKPILFGLCFAYLMVPVMNFVESKIRPPIARLAKKKKPHKVDSMVRGISVFVTVAVTGLFITGVVLVAVSQFAELSSLFSNLTTYANQFSKWLIALNSNLPHNTPADAAGADNPALLEPARFEIVTWVSGWFQSVSADLQTWFNRELLPQVNNMVQRLGNSVFGVVIALKNILLGFIISIYVLLSKDLFVAQTKRLLYALCKPSAANHIIGVTKKTHRIFGGFIVGKLLDSLIIGCLCFIVMSIFGWPLAILISFLIGLSNIIPFFGPFIGAIPSAFLLLLYDPKTCLYFIIFIIILQQVDGNIIGPKILGDSTGISGFWVLVSLLVGGGLFGFMGMLISVPTFAVIYTLCREATERRLQKKGLPSDTMEYRNIAKIEDSGRVISVSSLSKEELKKQMKP